jgi:hypothetical protein
MQKGMILSHAEKEARKQVVEQNRERKKWVSKNQSLDLVSVNIYHKRIIKS